VFLADAQPPDQGQTDSVPPLRIDTLDLPITLDGLSDDWDSQPGPSRDLARSGSEGEPPGEFRLRFRLGRHERNVYALFEVADDIVVRHGADFPWVEASDHVELAMVSADQEFLRFAIDEAGDGSARVWLVGSDGRGRADSRIEAAFSETDEGYRVEARLPRALIGARLGLAAGDVDDPVSREVKARLATSDLSSREGLGRVFVPSPELAALARGLGRSRSRLWILDARSRVLAQAGTLQAGRTPAPPPTWRQNLVAALRPIYGSILNQPTENFTDQGADALELQSAEIAAALRGQSSQWRRRTTDGRAAVLSAAEPVWSEGRVVGAVLAEETTNETLAARNRAFERLFFSIALVALFGASALLLFATSLSFRIRSLRNAVERAIDRQGRIRGEIPPSSAPDEVGDLARSFGTLLQRQQQYTSYLEGLRSRLSHEIRTPVGVVRSSLDNLRLQPIPRPAEVYLDRADEGLSRLVTVVQRMTEASRLEQTLATGERATFDLARVVSGCVEGYRLAHPQKPILFVGEPGGRPLQVEGAPDLVAQLLDKLFENALDFARPGTPIEIRLTRGLGVGLLAVSNEGPEIPRELADRIFDSMVSARPQETAGRVHLGLGLMIARAIADFHQAEISVTNRREASGVTFTVAFPLRPTDPGPPV